MDELTMAHLNWMAHLDTSCDTRWNVEDECRVRGVHGLGQVQPGEAYRGLTQLLKDGHVSSLTPSWAVSAWPEPGHLASRPGLGWTFYYLFELSMTNLGKIVTKLHAQIIQTETIQASGFLPLNWPEEDWAWNGPGGPAHEYPCMLGCFYSSSYRWMSFKLPDCYYV